jgi:hypothetical protein
MKYRNFDPETDQPISAAKILGELSQTKQFEKNVIDISQLLNKRSEKLTENKSNEKDLTSRTLKKYNRLARIINSKVTKRKESLKNSGTSIIHREHIKEYDDYLENRYPLANFKTKEICSKIVKERIKQLINEKD